MNVVSGHKPGFAWLVVAPFALVHVLLHLFTNGNYGVFRDEFYYWDCANHLAWGYVDQPPLSIALLAGWKTLFGDSVHSLRVLPAMAGAVLVLLSARLSAEMGGDRFAQAVAAMSTVSVPFYLVATGFYSMNAFELVFWAMGYWVVLRILEMGASPVDDRKTKNLWIGMGVIVGLGMMNKISMVGFALGFLVALLLTSHRRHLKLPYPYIAGLIAALIFLPHIIWQIQNGWPTVEFAQNAKRYKIADLSAGAYLTAQLLEMGPANVLVWAVGLPYLLFTKQGRCYRPFGWMFIAVVVFFVMQRSKPYYLMTAYTVLLAAGAVAIARFIASRHLRWLRPLVFVHLGVGLLVALPLALPVLPPEALVVYQQAIGIAPAAEERGHQGSELPQHFGDRFGWDDLTKTVASVYDNLSQEEQAHCIIVGRNYGVAGAINYYGRRYGLPRAVSTHNNYYLWGPGITVPNVFIVLARPEDGFENAFEDMTPVATIDAKFAMPEERGLVVYICRNLKTSLEEAWRAGRIFI
ncbi:MAG: glycosyltransferase family 39 protein [Candidatus Krumholzibacteria bacterium]|nr:glycosyltransferase family 39 protein [Candidatus Krumholzibacteria bacterium]